MLCAGIAKADRITFLPELGNSKQTDYALAREVPDDHVFEGDVTARLKQNSTPTALQTIQSNGYTFESTGSAIWDSIRQSNEIPLTDNAVVAKYRQQYLQQAYFTNVMLQRSTLFIAHMVKALDSRYLPVELALLPAIESGFQTHSVSRNNAVGLWQIVPITAQEIGLQRDRWYDGRADIVTSTTAAIDYLSYLNAEFNGDWELTLAAYNAGPGRVRRAVNQNRKAGKATNFAALELPIETRNYVPKLVALLQIIKDPNQTSIVLPQVTTEDAFEAVELDYRVSLDRLASLTGLPEKSLKMLNPGLTHGVTPPKGPHRIYVPRGSGDEVSQAINAASAEQLFTIPRKHVVVAGDTLGGIALRYGMSMSQLQALNRIDNDRIRIGQKLAVVDSRFEVEPELVQYVVAAGDTLSDIAEQFAVDVSEIVAAAGQPLKSDVIRAGQTLQIRVRQSNGS